MSYWRWGPRATGGCFIIGFGDVELVLHSICQSFSLGSSDDEAMPVSVSGDALTEEAVISEYRGA